MLKPICDALAASSAKNVGYGLVPDDTPQYMGKPEPVIYRHRKGQKSALWVMVECWENVPDGFNPVEFAPGWMCT